MQAGKPIAPTYFLQNICWVLEQNRFIPIVTLWLGQGGEIYQPKQLLLSTAVAYGWSLLHYYHSFSHFFANSSF
jgi:hypothetical protein